MCSLESQCIGNSLFANRVFISVVGIAFTIALPALFRAVMIPAYDRVAAVIQNPAVTDRCKGDFAIASVSLILISAVVNIITCHQCMVVIQLCTSRNSNFTVIADTAAILSFAAVVRDNRVGTDFDHTAVSDCGNCIVNQIYGCIICKPDICVSRISGSYSQSTDIVTLNNIFIYRIAGARNCKCRTVLYINIAAVHEDTAVSVILY